MAHPSGAHRQSEHEHHRVSHILKERAAGGRVHEDEVADRKLFGKMIKEHDEASRKADGGKPKHRLDRRARGGPVKGKGATHVNVIVAPQGGTGVPPGAALPAGAAPPVPAMPPPRPAMPAVMPPGVGMPPPQAGLAPPGALPPGAIRHAGGRTYKKGGRVTTGPTWASSMKAGTQVQHLPGKSDQKDVGRGPVITKASGGPVEAPGPGKGMGPKMHGGSKSGEGRLEKIRIEARHNTVS